MAVTLTEAAATKFKGFMEESKMPEGTFLRVAITSGGCSGYGYQLVPDQTFDEAKDSKYPQHGVDVVVDKKSSLYLDGTTIDWYSEFGKEGFTFDNPNAVKSCGCGSSFQA